jgi:hypothetical protein
MQHDPTISTRCRGSVTLELLLVIPVLLIVLIGAVEFGTIQIVQPAITQAAGVGARQAGKEGDIVDVVEAVNGVLAAINVEITADPNSGGKVILEDGTDPPVEFGDPNLDCDPPLNPVLDSDEVRVTVCVEVAATPVIDAHDSYGITLSGKRFRVSSVVKKEIPQTP